MMMKRSLVIASLSVAAVQGFAPVHVGRQQASSALHLGQDENTIPPNNNWFPKHDKCLIGDFYGELNTQKALKLNKPATENMLPLPEVIMMQQHSATAAAPAAPAAPVAAQAPAAVTQFA